MERNDEFYMNEAIKEAKKAYLIDEVPVGAVIVKDNIIISRAHNLRETKRNVLLHAEINAINKAVKKVGTKFLDGSVMYCTLEPCLMCAGAIQASRISRLVYSSKEPKFGVIESTGRVYDIFRGNHKVEISSGILEEITSKLMKDFFKAIREKKL